MRSLRHVNIDHLHVGWYQSTYYGSFVSRALLDSQFSYQHAIEESVVLIYGKQHFTLHTQRCTLHDIKINSKPCIASAGQRTASICLLGGLSHLVKENIASVLASTIGLNK